MLSKEWLTRKNIEGATYRILEIFMNHIERNPTCFENLAMLFKWLHFAPYALAICKEKLLEPLVIIFEKRIREILKRLSDQPKKDELANMFKKSLLEKSTFEDNLNEYFQKMNPSGQNLENILFDRTEEEAMLNRDLLMQRTSNDNSFQDSSAHVQKPGPTPPKKLVVPLLNLPTGNNRDSNPTIISRSTRRHEMLNKSSVSTSNRLPHLWTGDPVFNMSREPSLRDRRVSTGPGNDANMSYLDDINDANIARQYSMPFVDFPLS